MQEEQSGLFGYKSKVHKSEDFKNPNEGKPILNDSDEYVFKLIKEPHLIDREEKKKGRDGVERKIIVKKAVCEFEEKDTKNIVPIFFRVDSLNFAKKPEEESFESGVVKFFKKIKAPLPEDREPEWENHFVIGMRFRGRVVVKPEVAPDGTVVTKYYMDLPTARKLLPSDTAGEDFDHHNHNAPKTDEKALSLANAKLIVKGCATRADALCRLYEAGVAADVVDAFKAADDAKQIVYPI